MELRYLKEALARVKAMGDAEAKIYVQTFKDAQVLCGINMPLEFAQARPHEAMRIVITEIEKRIRQIEEEREWEAKQILEETSGRSDWRNQGIDDFVRMLLDVPMIDPDGQPLDANQTPIEDEHFRRLPGKQNVHWTGRIHYGPDGDVIGDMDYDILSPEDQKLCQTAGFFYVNTTSVGAKQIFEHDKPYIKIMIEWALEKYPQLLPRFACELYSKPNGEQGRLHPYRIAISSRFRGEGGLYYGDAISTKQLERGLIHGRTHLCIAILEGLIRNELHINYEAVPAEDLEPYFIFAQAAKDDAVFKSLFLEQELATYRDCDEQPLKRMVVKDGEYKFIYTGTPTNVERANYLRYLASIWRETLIKKVVKFEVATPQSECETTLLQMVAEDYAALLNKTAQPSPQTSGGDQPPKTGNGSGSGNPAKQGNPGSGSSTKQANPGGGSGNSSNGNGSSNNNNNNGRQK